MCVNVPSFLNEKNIKIVIVAGAFAPVAGNDEYQVTQRGKQNG
jgi:hypothetical protein